MSNTITIELCKEDRQRLDELIAFTGWIATELKSRPVVFNSAPPTPEIMHPADVLPPHGEPEPVAEPEKPKYTEADVRAMVQKLVNPKHPKRVEARALVKSYADKVSDIPVDKYNEVMERLTALEG